MQHSSSQAFYSRIMEYECLVEYRFCSWNYGTQIIYHLPLEVKSKNGKSRYEFFAKTNKQTKQKQNKKNSKTDIYIPIYKLVCYLEIRVLILLRSVHSLHYFHVDAYFRLFDKAFLHLLFNIKVRVDVCVPPDNNLLTKYTHFSMNGHRTIELCEWRQIHIYTFYCWILNLNFLLFMIREAILTKLENPVEQFQYRE